jgi:hypothetical protein
MTYKGDFTAGDTIDFKFTTRNFSTGAPFSLSGGTVAVYKGSSTTESTAGVTLTADFDSRTGLNHVTITTGSDGTFYSDGSQFDVVITAGTVNSVSVVGEAIGRFTLGAKVAQNSNIAAIKAKTDSLTFTVAGQVDANIQYVNDTLVQGAGTAGSPWGP